MVADAGHEEVVTYCTCKLVLAGAEQCRLHIDSSTQSDQTALARTVRGTTCPVPHGCFELQSKVDSLL